LNVRGREPEGAVEPADVQQLTAALARELGELPGPGGERLQHRIVVPADVYTEMRGAPPELMVFFDDLGYRALASVGHDSIYSPTNDTGPDACNHDWHGIFILAGPGVRARGRQADLNLTDITPTILGLFGLPHAELRGRDLSQGGVLA
jgi:predicted AlkP superfamily phosphohydrolase/phosphomutase